MTIPNQSRSTITLEPDRLQLILDRLEAGFYGYGVPAEQIAAAVLVDLKDFEKDYLALPH